MRVFSSALKFILAIVFLSTTAQAKSDHAIRPEISSIKGLGSRSDVFDMVLGHARAPRAKLSVLSATGTRPATCLSTRDPKTAIGGGVFFYTDGGMRKVAVVADRPSVADHYEKHPEELVNLRLEREKAAVPLTQAPLSVVAGMFDGLGRAESNADLREVASGTYIVKVPEHGSDSWYCRFRSEFQ